MSYKILISIILIISGFNNYAYPQEVIFENSVFDENIKTVEVYKKGFRYAYPVIRLNSDEQIILEFDELGESVSDLSYTIIHCNSDFSQSDLNPIEYIGGYEENQMNDYETSFNTRISYNHFYLEFPNEQIRPLVSGNYILLIYKNYDRESVVLQRRFYVLDEQCSIAGEVRRSSIVQTMMQNQELNFSISDNNSYISNPHDFLNVTVMQNNRNDRKVTNLKPDYIRGNTFDFLNTQTLNFPGGNEYRYYNTKTYRYTTDRIIHVEFETPYYVFTLYPDREEATLPYSYTQDINGDFLITAENVKNPRTEAEYVLVDFHFKNPPLKDAESIYVFGALSDWKISEQTKLTYNYTDELYELRLLQKQGFFNYEYVIANSSGDYLSDLTEGNFTETENNYAVFVYYRNPSSFFDELIGFTVINSLK